MVTPQKRLISRLCDGLRLAKRQKKDESEPQAFVEETSAGTDELRKEYGISIKTIEGLDLVKSDFPCCQPLKSFDDLEVPPPIGQALSTLWKFKSPTPIQRQCMPLALTGKSFLAVAPTGSGKTLAYLLPLMARLKPKSKPQVLILAPTRELVDQIWTQFELIRKSVAADYIGYTLAALQKCCLSLGKTTHDVADQATKKPRKKARLESTASSSKLDMEKLESIGKFSILFSTPGIALMEPQFREAYLKKVQTVVLDEMDELLNESFADKADTIFSSIKSERPQVLMFSATIPAGVLSMASTLVVPPLVIQVGQSNAAPAGIDQRLIPTADESGKVVTLRDMVKGGDPDIPKLDFPCLIFVQKKDRAYQLGKLLDDLHVKTGVLHSGIPKDSRQEILKDFKLGKLWCLVATDLLARGIDCYGVKLVLNYDFPTSKESYIHRIGRTGRAGERGRAVTFYTSQDIANLQLVVGVMKQSACPLPAFLQKLPRVDKKDLVKNPPKRRRICNVSHPGRRYLKQRQDTTT